jgi:ligand-binding SRPBCC domain-containing protein
MTDFRIETLLHCSRESAWEWISSVAGIAAEMSPFFRMTVPPEVRELSDLKVELGKPFIHSRVFLFGFVPAGHWDFTLVELEVGRGFVEESPSSTMKHWRHERRLLDSPGDPAAVRLSDHLTFEARFAPTLVGRFIERVFQHRHQVLRARLDRG